MTTVKPTDFADAEAGRVLDVIHSQLPALLHQLDHGGRQRPDPGRPDGPPAPRSRAQVAPPARTDLDRMQAALEHLRQQVQAIPTGSSAVGG